MPITVYYSSAATLRDELGVSSVVLPDDAANRLIRKAEGEIDRLIGVRPTDDTTGRKVVQTDVDAWQWTKLGRATTVIAAALYSNSESIDLPQWERVKGPDFEFQDPNSSTSREALNELDQSGLRRLTGSAHGRVPGRFDSFIRATRHAGP